MIKNEKKIGILHKIKKYKYFIFAHHPKCEKFNKDIFRIGSTEFCIGCFIGYPSALIGIFFGYFAFISPKINPIIIIVGSFLMMSTILLSFIPLTEKKEIKMIQKFFVGFGGGIFTCSVYFIIPGGQTTKIIGTIFIIFLLNFPISVLHYRNMNKKCDNCEYKPGWNQCPGFEINL
jgi:hypothetical protein